MTTGKVLRGKNDYFHVVGVVFCGWSSSTAIDGRLPFMSIHPPQHLTAEQIATRSKEIVSVWFCWLFSFVTPHISLFQTLVDLYTWF